MKIEYNQKYATVSFYAVITFAICLLLVVVVQKNAVISGALASFAKVVAPVTWGIVIAYIVNPLMKFFERVFSKCFERNKPRRKLVRSLSVAFGLLSLIAVLFAIVAILLPQVVESIIGIARNFNSYLINFESWIYKFVEDYPDIYPFVQTQFDNLQPKLTEFINNLVPKLGELAIKLKDGALGFIVGIKDFVIGFIVAIYLLFSKEKFIAQLRKVVAAILPEGGKNAVYGVASRTNKMLSGFISGKLIDSTIIGILTFICMSIMKMDFVALISIVIGVTNIIPFFGPFIGAIPSAFLLLFAAPRQVIPFVIFIIILQQFDGNILGPKILGDSTGLSPFWVMFAIFVGGGLFGFAGMILGVPIFAVIYSLVRDIVNFLLAKKGLSTRTADYYAGDVPVDSEKQDIMHKPLSLVFKSKKNKPRKNADDASEDDKKE
ncbi:MAG: AI-2E family transporter [Oscillospiraceae bacterium]